MTRWFCRFSTTKILKLIPVCFQPPANQSSLMYSTKGKPTKGVLHVNVLDEEGKFLFSGTIDAAKRYAKKYNLHLINYDGGQQATSKAIQMQVLSKKKVTADETTSALSEEQQQKRADARKANQNVRKFSLNESISDHDLDIKLRKIAYFLNKKQRIRVVVSGFKIDQKFNVLDKIKKRFSPHLSFKQIVNNSSSVKFYIVAEKTFGDFYETKYLKGKEELQNVEDEADEEELFSNEDLEDLINEKLK